LALLNQLFPAGRTRVLAFAVWTAALGSAFAIGPIIGGYLATYFSWRWSFFMNIPLMLVAALGIFAAVPPVALKLKETATDYLGAALLVFGVAFFILGVQEGTGWGWFEASGQSILGSQWPYSISAAFMALVLGVLLLVVLLIFEVSRYRRGQETVLEPSLFRVRSFTWGTAAAALMTAAVFGLLLMVPLYAQYVLDYDPLGAGLTLLALGLGMAIGGPVVSRLKIAADRRTVVAMLIIQPLAMLTVIPLLSTTGNSWMLAPSLFVEGFAWGAAYAILVSTLMADIPEDLSGTAGGTQTAVRLLAGALGTAILTTVLLVSISDQVARVNESGLSATQQQQITQLYTLSGQAHAQTVDPNGDSLVQLRQIAVFDNAINEVKDDMVRGFQLAIGLSVVIGVTAIPCGLRLPRHRSQ
jgi:predicted MFS family arabinose efflux permease